MPIRELGHFTVRRLFAIAVQRRRVRDEINASLVRSYLGLFKIDESPRNRVQQKRFLLNNDAQLHFLVTTSCGVVVARTFQIRGAAPHVFRGFAPW